jgi:DNA-dependent RNA polymerase auxiliary subunit epsilon
MEEKVFYQSEERLIDIRENLSSLETKLNSLEHQVSMI